MIRSSFSALASGSPKQAVVKFVVCEVICPYLLIKHVECSIACAKSPHITWWFWVSPDIIPLGCRLWDVTTSEATANAGRFAECVSLFWCLNGQSCMHQQNDGWVAENGGFSLKSRTLIWTIMCNHNFWGTIFQDKPLYRWCSIFRCHVLDCKGPSIRKDEHELVKTRSKQQLCDHGMHGKQDETKWNIMNQYFQHWKAGGLQRSAFNQHALTESSRRISGENMAIWPPNHSTKKWTFYTQDNVWTWFHPWMWCCKILQGAHVKHVKP